MCELLEEGEGVSSWARVPDSWSTPLTLLQGVQAMAMNFLSGHLGTGTWDDVGDPTGTAGWMRRRKGQAPVPGLLTRQWRGDRLLLSAGQDPLSPPHWAGKGSRLVPCGPRAPAECSELSLQGLCKAHPGLPGLQGESCEGRPHLGQGSQGCGHKLSFILQSSFKYEALSSSTC